MQTTTQKVGVKHTATTEPTHTRSFILRFKE